ncbi:MAG: ABC transporter ATP-binding protein [Verrucomicrobiaceae bacterium]|nr:ABC transporter ATP-binding protein [Verrucomicrobiaceae bacterium]
MNPEQEVSNSVIVRRLTKEYGSVKAIDNVSFRIGKGEIVGFLGPNGAGKSTTMKIISGLMPATSGNVEIWGINVATNPDKAKLHIGFMPENNPLPEDLRVDEYLKFRAQIKGIPRKEVANAVEEVMEICQLNRKAYRKIIGNLSKGFRQRVGIADAILAHPDVIIMDEPTIGLDPHQILAIRDLINSLRGKMSVIISSHILPEIELVCDRVIIINQGAIVASGTPDSLRKEFISNDRYVVSLRMDGQEFTKQLKCIYSEGVVEKTKDVGNGFFEHTIVAPVNSNLGALLISEFSKDSSNVLREVSYKKPTLEEIFISATRRSWEQVLQVQQKAEK